MRGASVRWATVPPASLSGPNAVQAWMNEFRLVTDIDPRNVDLPTTSIQHLKSAESPQWMQASNLPSVPCSAPTGAIVALHAQRVLRSPTYGTLDAPDEQEDNESATAARLGQSEVIRAEDAARGGHPQPAWGRRVQRRVSGIA